MKKVVYTVLTGHKEFLNDPFQELTQEPPSEPYEKICFTDNPYLESETWSIRLLETHYLKPELESRRPKILPHIFLADFDISLYIDNTVKFKVDPSFIFNSSSRSSLVCFRHPNRNCAYDEGEEIIRLGFETEAKIRQQLDFYDECGFPRQFGLIAGTVLLRQHKDPELIAFSEEWFEHILAFSRRDQVSFSFVQWHRKFVKLSFFDGTLTNNDIIHWHGFKTNPRVPGSFDDQLYRWLNPQSGSTVSDARKHYLSEGFYQKLPYRKYSWQLNQIANKYKTDKGSLYYNSHGYASVYEIYLSQFKHDPLKLLEIGLLRHDQQNKSPTAKHQNIPSLRMWREFLPNAQIYGFDIADFKLLQNLEKVTLIQGDMGHLPDLAKLVNITGQDLDIIIDDASHASHHQQIALTYLFDSLKPGGLYFVEDLHYQPSGLEIENFPKTLDVLKHLEYGIYYSSPCVSQEDFEKLNQNIEFIRFYDSLDRNFGSVFTDSLAVIKKKDQVEGTTAKNQIYVLIEITRIDTNELKFSGIQNIFIKLIEDCYFHLNSERVHIVFVINPNILETFQDFILNIAFEYMMEKNHKIDPLFFLEFTDDIGEIFPGHLISIHDLNHIFVLVDEIFSEFSAKSTMLTSSLSLQDKFKNITLKQVKHLLI